MSEPPSTPPNYLQEIGTITQALEAAGVEPILIGGMALVILGSRRVTQDFDFVIAKPTQLLPEIVDIFYDKGLELVSRLDKAGNVLSTIDNRKIAAIRIRLDAPASIYFFNRKTGLKIDLLFDFPIPATDLLGNAKKIKVAGHTLHMASEADLMRLKKIANSSRSKPGDADDIAFLKSRLKKSTS